MYAYERICARIVRVPDDYDYDYDYDDGEDDVHRFAAFAKYARDSRVSRLCDALYRMYVSIHICMCLCIAHVCVHMYA